MAEKISDARMDELIQRAKAAATRGIGGGDGSNYREEFYSEVYTTILGQLIANEMVDSLHSERQKIKK